MKISKEFICRQVSSELRMHLCRKIRNALLDFKESGKFIIAYGDSYTQGLYYLSSVADKVLLNPKGMIEWKGIASAPLFYKTCCKRSE